MSTPDNPRSVADGEIIFSMGNVHERLKSARIAAGYAVASDAARAFGWPISTYLGHENGDRSPSRAAAQKYAAAFRIRAGYLLYGEGMSSEPTGVSGRSQGRPPLEEERVAHVFSALLQMFRPDISLEDALLWTRAALVRARQPEDPAIAPDGLLREQIQAQFGAQKLAPP